jgi:hypothetical protein
MSASISPALISARVRNLSRRFDHRLVLADYVVWRDGEARPRGGDGSNQSTASKTFRTERIARPPLILATSSDCRSLLGLALGQKVLQPKVSNRAIAKTLGVDEGTIRNDRADRTHH